MVGEGGVGRRDGRRGRHRSLRSPPPGLAATAAPAGSHRRRSKRPLPPGPVPASGLAAPEPPLRCPASSIAVSVGLRHRTSRKVGSLQEVRSVRRFSRNRPNPHIGGIFLRGANPTHLNCIQTAMGMRPTQPISLQPPTKHTVKGLSSPPHFLPTTSREGEGERRGEGES